MTSKKQPENSRSRNRQKNKRYGTTRKAVLIERSAEFVDAAQKKANQRFDLAEKPLGIPEEIEDVKKFSFDWKNSPVPLRDEESLSKFVLRKGEFGWLEDDRVQEIADFVDKKKMTLDQALSLRSALLQQKTVCLLYTSPSPRD